MIYLKIALLCSIIMSGSTSDDDTIDDIISEEIRQLLHTNFVPKYEFVKVHLSEKSHKREIGERRNLHIRAFGEDINLWLELGNNILAGEDTPVYYAKYSPFKPQNVAFSRRDGLMQKVGRIFEDPVRRASLVIGVDESGSPTVNGNIGSKRLGIKSLPTRLAKVHWKRQGSVDNSDDADLPRHIVFQTSENNETDSSVTDINSTALWQNSAQSTKGVIPDTLYLEVLVVAEYSVCRTYGQDTIGLLQYILAFFNDVDLKYRSIESPKMRLHISGIVLARDAKATPYISKNSLGVDVFNTRRALPDSTYFFYAVKNTFPLESYDIPLTMTRQLFGVNGSEFIMGQAWVGAVCKKDDIEKTVNSVTIIQDDGAFGGVYVAAHEIGHLIGASHDTNETIDDCLDSNGFIMSYTPLYTKNSSDFSSCSIDSIDKMLKESKLDCLFNSPPSVGKSLPKLMPGRIKNLEEQCKSRRRKAPCQNPDGPTDICINIFCENDDGECLGTGIAAIDGTTCGDNRFCLHMKCVSLEGTSEETTSLRTIFV